MDIWRKEPFLLNRWKTGHLVSRLIVSHWCSHWEQAGVCCFLHWADGLVGNLQGPVLIEHDYINTASCWSPALNVNELWERGTGQTCKSRVLCDQWEQTKHRMESRFNVQKPVYPKKTSPCILLFWSLLYAFWIHASLFCIVDTSFFHRVPFGSIQGVYKDMWSSSKGFGGVTFLIQYKLPNCFLLLSRTITVLKP